MSTLARFVYFAQAVVAGHWMVSDGIEHFHVHFSSTVGLLATRVFPLTMSVTFHGPDEFSSPDSFHLAEKVAASRFVVAISSFARSQLLRVSAYPHWQKVCVCRLGVDASVFAPRPCAERSDPFEVLCVARLARVKAQHILLDAVARLIGEGRRVRLHLAGDGDERTALEAHAASLGIGSSVVFHGWLNQDAVQALYRRADVFVLPSFAEGVPVVLMEAMAMEIPCIATYIAGVPELIENEIDGLLVPASDTEALSRGIARLMDDPELRRTIGAASRVKVLRDFNLSRNAELLAGIFHERTAGVCRDDYQEYAPENHR